MLVTVSYSKHVTFRFRYKSDGTRKNNREEWSWSPGRGCTEALNSRET